MTEQERDKLLLKIDAKLEKHDEMFTKIDERLDKIDTRLEKHDEMFTKIDERLDKIDTRLEKHDKMFIKTDARLEKLEEKSEETSSILEIMQATMKEISSQIVSIKEEIRNLSGSIARMEVEHGGKIQLLLDLVSEPLNKVYSMKSKVDSHEERLDEHGIRIGVLESKASNP